ncbi:hypothetical protein RS9917_01062 [Synechococcus sp. RS9917]|nr:hypothetical protein RS9917_01062 [Synechococcus sp. RS9917]
MRQAADALASAWGRPLRHHACGEAPDPLLAALAGEPDPVLLRLTGDAAAERPDGAGWLEALAAWRQPTLLVAAPSADGTIPGVVPAYAALCTSLRVPLLGLVQLGGAWRPERRRRDGLPWCGVCLEQGDPADDLTPLVDQLKTRLARGVGWHPPSTGAGSACRRGAPGEAC